MRTGSKQKLKYVIILEILRQETDAEHPMQTNTLLKKLEEQGIGCSRETLYSDIKALNQNGYEILCNRRNGNFDTFRSNNDFYLCYFRDFDFVGRSFQSVHCI